MLAKFVTTGNATVWLFGQTARSHVSNLAINGVRATDTLAAIRAAAVQEINRGNQRNEVSFDAVLRAGSEADNLAAYAAIQQLLAADGDFYLVEEPGDGSHCLADAQVQIALARNLGASWIVRVTATGGGWSSTNVTPPDGFAEITGQNTRVTVAVEGMTEDGIVRVNQINVGDEGVTLYEVTCAEGEFHIDVPQCPEFEEGDGNQFHFSYDVVRLA